MLIPLFPSPLSKRCHCWCSHLPQEGRLWVYLCPKDTSSEHTAYYCLLLLLECSAPRMLPPTTYYYRPT